MKWGGVGRSFNVLENPNRPDESSRAYANPWIIKNRYQNHATLATLEGKPVAWPPTNMVIVAEKPEAGR